MLKLLLPLLFALSSEVAVAASAVPTSDQVAACYQKAEDDQQRHACLELEMKLVEAEHKRAVERVSTVAKAWDKPQRTKLRWEKLIRANQSFDAFVRRECDFVRYTTKGSRTKEQNAELACRINYYRMHVDVLENRYLPEAK